MLQSLDVVGAEVHMRFMCCETRTPRQSSSQIRLGGGGRPDVRIGRRPLRFERSNGGFWLLHRERELEEWSDSACATRDWRGGGLESTTGAKGGTDPACHQSQRPRLAVVSVRVDMVSERICGRRGIGCTDEACRIQTRKRPRSRIWKQNRELGQRVRAFKRSCSI